MRGVVLCKSRDVEIVQDAGSEFNFWWCVQYGRKRELRCRWEEWIYIPEFLRFGSYPVFFWLMNTNTAQTSSWTTNRHLMYEEPRVEI
jgi:hypothetical protein